MAVTQNMAAFARPSVVSTDGGPSPPAMNAIRVLASYCIIWIHTPRSTALLTTTVWARFAVPFFVAAAVFFVVRSGIKENRKSLFSYSVSRFNRIYVPFLAWSVIYLLFKCVKLVLAPQQPNDFPGIDVLFVGSAYHLWFLPFIFLVSLAAYATTCWVNTRHEYGILALYVAIGFGLLICVSYPPRPDNYNTVDGVVYMFFALPSAMWGLALGLSYARGGWRTISHPACTVAALLATIAVLFALRPMERNLLYENLAGTGMLVVALTACRLPGTRWLEKLAPLAFGIYLSHLLVIKVCEAFAAKLSLEVTAQLDATLFAIAVVGSTAITFAVTKSPRTRWLVG